MVPLRQTSGKLLRRLYLAVCVVLLLCACLTEAKPAATGPSLFPPDTTRLYLEWLEALKQHFGFAEWADKSSLASKYYFKRLDLSSAFDRPCVQFDCAEAKAVQFFKSCFVAQEATWPPVYSEQYRLAPRAEALVGPVVTLWVGATPRQARSAWLASLWKLDHLPEFSDVTDDTNADVLLRLEQGKLFLAFGNVACFFDPQLSGETDLMPLAKRLLAQLEARAKGEGLPPEPGDVLEAARLLPSDVPGMRLTSWRRVGGESPCGRTSGIERCSLLQKWLGELAGLPCRMQVTLTSTPLPRLAPSGLLVLRLEAPPGRLFSCSVAGLNASLSLRCEGKAFQQKRFLPEQARVTFEARGKALINLMKARAEAFAANSPD